MDPKKPDPNNPPDAASFGVEGLTRVRGASRGERWFRSLVQNSSDVVMILEADGTIRYVSPAVERVLGYRPEEMVGSLALDYVHPEDVEHMSKSFVQSLEKPGVHPPVEYRVRTADGSWRYMEAIRSNWLGDPHIAGVVANVRDVTERKEAEEDKGRQAHHAALRADVSGILAEGGTLQNILQRCAECIVRHLDAAFARIWTLDEEEGLLELRASAGVYTHLDGAYSRVPVGSFKIGLIAQERLPHLTNDVINDPWVSDKRWAEREGMVAFAGHPLVVEDRLVGVMAMFAREPLEKDTIEALASVADTVAHGIERKRTEEALWRSESSLATAQRIAHLGNWDYDVTKDEARWSDEMYRIFGFTPQQFVPRYRTFLNSVHPDDRALIRRSVREALYEEKRGGVDYRVVRPDGEIRVVQSHYEVVREGSNRAVKLVGTVHDITERKALEEQLEHRALHDPLTDLPNRQLLVDRLGQALGRTRRRPKHKVGVLFTDLDGFKVVNDSLGHDTGDRLLVAVAERLKGCLRPEDTLARFAGDEFIVLLEEVEGADDAFRVTQRITEEFREPFVLDERELTLRFSIGVALGEADTESPEELLRDADTAMYRAKDEAADYRVFDPEMHEQALERLELESYLRHALEREELTVYYQPKFRLGQEQDRIEGVESLVRWEHPQRGFTLPGEFLPLAEETGLIVPIGGWVMKEACRQAKEWQERHPSEPPLAMCVNLSAGQVRHPGLLQDVRSALQESGLEPGSLILEITENTLLKDTQVIETVFKELKALGVRLAIDDFGKEYSSLSYLGRLPVDALKIDRSFLESFGENPSNLIIVEAVISLAHSLGLEVTGEGVESAEQLELLRGMGCDFVQGYHLARPMPQEDVPGFLAE